MSIERTYYCEGPDCGGEGGLRGGHTSAHCTTATPPPHLPSGFVEVREGGAGEPESHHFCGWECVMKYAAKLPPPEVISFDDESDPHDP